MSFSNAHAPRYDLGLNPPYQINYRAKRAGKHITATKRRITFQFGFSSADAIREGRSEADCRGEEHEVVLVWSHITGKRQLFMDGREFHASRAARGNTRFEHSWSIPGNHVLKIVANGAPPITAEGARQFKQFDLQLDGMSYFEFSKIYELGTKDVGVASPREEEVGGRRPVALPAPAHSCRGAAYDARDDDADDEEEDARRPPLPQAPAPAVDLFDSRPTPIEVDLFDSHVGSIPSLVGCTSNSDSLQSPYYDEFAPSASRSSFDSISNEILGAYDHAPSHPAPVDAAHSSSRALVPVSEEGVDAATRSFKNLVNLDDITTTPSLQQASLRGRKAVSSSPASWNQVGRAPTLAEIRDSQSSPTMPARPVMKVHEFPQAGYYQPQAIVPYGAAPSSYHQAAYGYGHRAPTYAHGNRGQYGY
ncbi:hypothetical protein ACHAW5_006498 [Stephanodiscus triporus]|uniref:Galectin n=1 Tax=Stephanodiscus triporus TaxID=2934178 RepID=A0ABD3NLF2_9STRA